MRFFLLLVLFLFGLSTVAQDTLRLPDIDAVFYSRKNGKQPLVVALGGSEGGNAWASRHWKKTRDRFLDSGYAFLAIGYFKTGNSPQLLEKIALENVYQAIRMVKSNLFVDSTKIAIVGGSRGADLALLLASYYPDISCVVGLSASHAVFPGNTSHLSSSSFTWKGQQLAFVPVNEAAYPYILKRDLRGAFEAMLHDTVAEEKALIKVENSNASILLISGMEDEICPSAEMSDKMMQRLKRFGHKHPYELLKVKGGHAQPLLYFDYVFDFLSKQIR